MQLQVRMTIPDLGGLAKHRRKKKKKIRLECHMEQTLVEEVVEAM